LVTTTKLDGFNVVGNILTPVWRNDFGLPDYVTQRTEIIQIFLAVQSANNTVGIISPVPPEGAWTFSLPTNSLRALQCNITVGTFEFWEDIRRQVENGETEADNGTRPCIYGQRSSSYFDAVKNRFEYCAAYNSVEVRHISY